MRGEPAHLQAARAVVEQAGLWVTSAAGGEGGSITRTARFARVVFRAAEPQCMAHLFGQRTGGVGSRTPRAATRCGANLNNRYAGSLFPSDLLRVLLTRRRQTGSARTMRGGWTGALCAWWRGGDKCIRLAPDGRMACSRTREWGLPVYLARRS